VRPVLWFQAAVGVRVHLNALLEMPLVLEEIRIIARNGSMEHVLLWIVLNFPHVHHVLVISSVATASVPANA